MIDKSEININQYSQQIKPSENNTFSQPSEENKFFLNTFENHSIQMNVRNNSGTFQSANEENQVKFIFI